MDERFQTIVDRGLDGRRISEEDCEYILSFPEVSVESDHLIDRVDRFVRGRCDNTGEVGVQIGVIVGPCYVDCGFCNFAYSTTDVEDFTMGEKELTGYLESVTADGLVSSVSLMTIHGVDMDDYLRLIETARSVLPEDVIICSNTGDLEPYEIGRAHV